jgi:hypothetical protein
MESDISILVLSLILLLGPLLAHFTANLNWKRRSWVKFRQLRFGEWFARIFDVTEQMQALYQKVTRLRISFNFSAVN